MRGACVWVHRPAVCMYRSWGNRQGSRPISLHLIPLRQGLQEPGLSLKGSELQLSSCVQSSYLGTWGLNSGPLACTASTITHWTISPGQQLSPVPEKWVLSSVPSRVCSVVLPTKRGAAEKSYVNESLRFNFSHQPRVRNQCKVYTNSSYSSLNLDKSHAYHIMLGRPQWCILEKSNGITYVSEWF